MRDGRGIAVIADGQRYDNGLWLLAACAGCGTRGLAQVIRRPVAHANAHDTRCLRLRQRWAPRS